MARDFNGTSGKIQFDTTVGQEGSTCYSFHFRLFRDTGGEGGYGQVFEWQDGGATARWWFENDSGDAGWGAVFKVKWSGGDGAWSVAYPTNGIWYDYVVTYDGSSTANDPIIYRDGSSVTITERAAPSGTLPINQTTLVIGNRIADDLTWDGRLAEFAIWNRVLTSTEANQIGVGNSPLLIPGGLIFYSPLIGDTSPEPDLIGGITGTVTGTTQITHPTVYAPNVITKKMYLVQGFQ